MQTAYINTLTTGLYEETIRITTANWWGVYDAKSVLETLGYLKNKGLSCCFPAVYSSFLCNEEERTEK